MSRILSPVAGNAPTSAGALSTFSSRRKGRPKEGSAGLAPRKLGPRCGPSGQARRPTLPARPFRLDGSATGVTAVEGDGSEACGIGPNPSSMRNRSPRVAPPKHVIPAQAGIPNGYTGHPMPPSHPACRRAFPRCAREGIMASPRHTGAACQAPNGASHIIARGESTGGCVGAPPHHPPRDAVASSRAR